MSGMTNSIISDGSGLVQGALPEGLFNKPRQPDVWYREPWLLLVIGGPALVVVACAVTVYLAITRPDPLVSKYYYRDGLRINQTMAAEEAARSLVLSKARHAADAVPASAAGAASEANQGLRK